MMTDRYASGVILGMDALLFFFLVGPFGNNQPLGGDAEGGRRFRDVIYCLLRSDGMGQSALRDSLRVGG
jgi:hypothetical protein